MDLEPPQLRQPAVSAPTDSPNYTLTALAASLQDAAMAARYLPSSSFAAAGDPSQLHRAFDALQAAHRHLSAFLSCFPQPVENSVDSTGAAAADTEEADELMADHEEREGDVSWKTMDEVEEGMRDFAIQSKRRRKRRLSPNCGAERAAAAEGVREFGSIDHEERMRSLDLIFQFHG